ncbi:MAG: HAD family hydrolase [Acidimicrobiia bacterium]|jgi:phosphoglycolate phosphatase-like HAD superfamily hydrolase
MSAVAHVVWDWNGTLFDDLHVVVEAVNGGLSAAGRPPITLDDYRDHYTRPVKVFYDRLFGREVTVEEWQGLDRRFHEGYRELLGRARLTSDAETALETVAASGVSQSLLSMFPHEELVPLVARLGIARFFDRIDGLVGPPGDRKAAYLGTHLRALVAGEDPSQVLVIGDTPDDAEAAAHVGARCVLYDNGSHHRRELEAAGVPVVESLVAAVITVH